ncbi:MAG: hypothetical protein FD169_140 [Bacillota bacterium]|nr:MAG: hypothetical protein FD169_140 [Bacillota bacterium]
MLHFCRTRSVYRTLYAPLYVGSNHIFEQYRRRTALRLLRENLHISFLSKYVAELKLSLSLRGLNDRNSDFLLALY